MAQTVPRLRRAIVGKSPSLDLERELWAGGADVVAGIDEVGKGSWAGPLTLVAAVVPKDVRIYKVRDSKMLTESEREALFDRVAGWCENWGIGHASSVECDELGMSEAQRLAARRALADVGRPVDHVLVDGKWDFVETVPVTTVVKGDAHCLSIAAASVLAKVTRDRIMRQEAERFPLYNFENNKGYPCPHHRAALHETGPTEIHRHSWAFMDNLAHHGMPRLPRPSTQPTLF